MGKFFNDKEQVIDLQMTQFGKHLLSKDKFRPVFYDFFDDDVLYDSQYGSGISESQNSTETRIKEETPRLETQYVYSGAETEVKRINKLIRSGKAEFGEDAVQPIAESQYSMTTPLGNSSLVKDYAPALSVDFLNGEIKSSIQYKQESYHPTLKIPQISSSLKYELFVDEATEGETEGVFEDGSVIKIKRNYLLFQISEKNVDFLNENFDIEVYEIEESGSTSKKTGKEEVLIPLSFVKGEERDPLILRDLPEEKEKKDIEIDSTYAEYYFDILVDNEIDTAILCKAKAENKTKDIFTDDTINCPDKEETKEEENIYDVPLEEFIGEECD